MQYNAGEYFGCKFSRENCWGRLAQQDTMSSSASMALQHSAHGITAEPTMRDHDQQSRSFSRTIPMSTSRVSPASQSHPTPFRVLAPPTDKLESASVIATTGAVGTQDAVYNEKPQSLSVDLSRLESLVIRLEIAMAAGSNPPTWLDEVTTEPAWCTTMRNEFRAPKDSGFFNRASDQEVSLGDIVPRIPSVDTKMMQPVREQDVNRLVDEAMRPWIEKQKQHAGQEELVNGTPVPARSFSREPAKAAVAISEALLPKLQQQLTTEIVKGVEHAFVKRSAKDQEQLEDNQVWVRDDAGLFVQARSVARSLNMDVMHSLSDDAELLQVGDPMHMVESKKQQQRLGRAQTSPVNQLGIVVKESKYGYSKSNTCAAVMSQSRERGLTGDSTQLAKLGNTLRSAPTGLSGLPCMPVKAFVVNFQRLIFMTKVFKIIHDFINSTVVASLTLVRVASIYQLGVSCAFMACNFIIYSAHYCRFDTLEIDDYMNLSDLLRDDDNICNGKEVDNPNRLVKALSFSRYGRRMFATMFVNVMSFLVCAGLWTFFLLRYIDVIHVHMSDDDKELTLTLLLVGSMVMLFHLTYEWLFWRETRCVMPHSPSSKEESWDPRVHGLPPGLRWFGLPSMWFTSKESLACLQLWIAKAKGVGRIYGMYPQEMAMLALDKDNGKLLCAGLAHAKLYDSAKGHFLKKDGDRYRPVRDMEDPDELDISLVYYDSLQRVHGQKLMGEYLMPEEQYVRTEMRRITDQRSQMTPGSSQPYGLEAITSRLGFSQPEEDLAQPIEPPKKKGGDDSSDDDFPYT